MTNDLATDTAAVVLAGGKGARLGALTRDVCKPALPFGSAYRNIDFSLSNCVNSGIRRVGIATQYKPATLIGHIDKIWSPIVAEPGEYIAAWPAESRAPCGGYRGTADAVFRNLDLLEATDSSLVLVLAGDHVYRMDYGPMLERHRASGADATIGCIEIAVEESSQFGIVSVDGHGRIDGFIEKPRTLSMLPSRERVLASMGIYVFDARFLADALRQDARSSTSLHDFGGDVLPTLVRTARVFAYPFLENGGRSGYWRDVGTPTSYWQAHLDLVGSAPRMRLDDALWPMPASLAAPRLSARYAGSCRDRDAARSLIAEDCAIAGTVRRSAVFSQAQIGAGALVEETVVLPGAVIGRNSRIRGAIVDSDVRIPDGMVIDYARRESHGGRSEPLVVTAEQLSLELAGSFA
jgi:glucose-1-phosphate adenylyltransferase